MSSGKYSSVYAINSFSTNDRFTQLGGSIKLGTNTDTNYDGIRLKSGSAYTQGNRIKSSFDLNDNGPLTYNCNDTDKANVISIFGSIFEMYPLLLNNVYLYPTKSSGNIAQSAKFPIFNFSGKGVGKIEWYSAGNTYNGDPLQWSTKTVNAYKLPTFRGKPVFIPRPENTMGIVQPYSGYMYSGTLVQYAFDTSDYENQRNTVIPYQSGRGVPQYNPLKKYFSGNPFGIPVWNNTKLPILPKLSTGVTPGNNDLCVGVVMDQETLSKNKVYSYQPPIGAIEFPKQFPKFDQFPAPFTSGAANISFNYNKQYIVSPGPNNSETFYAPWPNIYAYRNGNSVPVLTKGKSSLRIGAATNIGMQAYYIPDILPGDNPINNNNYTSVSIIPLFQGEKVKIGSNLFVSAMGNIITPNRTGVSPYPLGSFANSVGSAAAMVSGDNTIFFLGIARNSKEENPWFEWTDPTFGAVGWTSTPGFGFAAIPDLGKAIIESKISTLDFLIQSTQGSAIIQGSTFINPNSPEGSGRMELLGSPKYLDSEKIIGKNLKFDILTQCPEIAERGLCIGNTVQEIEGTGRWDYTGTYSDITLTLNKTFGYFDDGITQIYAICISELNGMNKIVQITGDINTEITSITVISPGNNYTTGEITRLKLLNFPYTYANGSYHTLGDNAVVEITSDPMIVNNVSGSNYYSATNVNCFNLTQNSLVISAYITNPIFYGVIGFNEATIDLIKNLTVKNVVYPESYPLGTQFYIMNYNKSEKYTKSGPLGIGIVTSNDGTTITVAIYKMFHGDIATYEQGQYDFSTQKLDKVSPIVSISVNDNKTLSSVNITDFGIGNNNNDLILIVQNNSDKNGIFKLNNIISELNTSNVHKISGGIYYNFLQPTSIAGLAYQNNAFGTYNDGKIIPEYALALGIPDHKGTIDILSYDSILTGALTTATVIYTPESTIIAPFQGIYNVLFRPFIPSVYQPGPGTLPPDSTGWYNYNIINSATFKPFAVAILGQLQLSTNYVPGIYAVSGGSGTDMTLVVNQVDNNGNVLSVTIENQGTGYLINEQLLIVGGDNNCYVYLGYPSSTQIRYDGFRGDYTLNIIKFGFKMISLGTGYSVGNNIPTLCPNRQGTLLAVEILHVGINGEILFMRIRTNGFTLYQIGEFVTVNSGNGDCVFQLTDPDEIDPIELTNSGNNYTTGTASLINVKTNTLNLMCSLSAGNCIPSNYASFHYKPFDWIISEYSVGEQLKMVQTIPNTFGPQVVNDNAIIEISSIDYYSKSISFIIINPGSGYSLTPTGDNWAFVPAVKLPAFIKGNISCDIVANANGEIQSFSNLVQLNTSVYYGDYFYVMQGTNTSSCIVQLRSIRDVPPMWELEENGREPDYSQWNKYNGILKSSINLLDKGIITELYQNHPEHMNNSYYTAGDGGMPYDRNYGKYTNV
jgi:hypothetical protein